LNQDFIIASFAQSAANRLKALTSPAGLLGFEHGQKETQTGRSATQADSRLMDVELLAMLQTPNESGYRLKTRLQDFGNNVQINIRVESQRLAVFRVVGHEKRLQIERMNCEVTLDAIPCGN
jgi:hypothetical protein